MTTESPSPEQEPEQEPEPSPHGGESDLITDKKPDTQSQLERQYKGYTIKLPIFGRIPVKPSEFFADLRVRHNPPLWAQFFKYGICGVIATLVLGLVWTLARIYIPQYISNDLPEETKKINSAYVMLVAFIIANFVAYFSNRIFVFTPGKHTFIREMSLFFIISAISFTAGNFAKNWFIEQGTNIDLAALSFAISSALVNFVARKYLVFSNSSEPNNPDTVSTT